MKAAEFASTLLRLYGEYDIIFEGPGGANDLLKLAGSASLWTPSGKYLNDKVAPPTFIVIKLAKDTYEY